MIKCLSVADEIYLGWIRLDDSDVLGSLWSQQMNLLLVCTYDLVVITLENVVDEMQEFDHVSQQLGGDALARGVDGHFAPGAREHESSSKHAYRDGLAKPARNRRNLRHGDLIFLQLKNFDIHLLGVEIRISCARLSQLFTSSIFWCALANDPGGSSFQNGLAHAAM